MPVVGLIISSRKQYKSLYIADDFQNTIDMFDIVHVTHIVCECRHSVPLARYLAKKITILSRHQFEHNPSAAMRQASSHLYNIDVALVLSLGVVPRQNKLTGFKSLRRIIHPIIVIHVQLSSSIIGIDSSNDIIT